MKKSMKSVALAGLVALALGMPGCGNKNLDTTVLESNHWVLQTMNGADVKTLFEGPAPTIEFNFTDSVVYGSSGCNRYTGGFTLADGKLQAPHMASTRMACPFKNAEDEFLMIFAGEDGVAVSLENNNQLLKFRQGESVLEFVIGNELTEE